MLAQFQEIVDTAKGGEKKERHDFLLCRAFASLLLDLNRRYKRKEITLEDATKEKEEIQKEYEALVQEISKQAKIWKERQEVLKICGQQMTESLKMIRDGADPERIVMVMAHLVSVMMDDPFIEREAKRRWSN